MKKDSKRNKKIRSLVLICVLSALLLTVGTYAWFIGMTTVKVNSFEVNIATVDSLMLSMDGINWKNELTDIVNIDAYDKNANEFLTDENEGLKPISTNGEFDSTVSRLKLYEKGSLTSTDGGYRLMTSRVDNYTNKVTGGTEYLEGDGYVAFDLFVMNLSGDAYYSENNTANEEAIYLTYDSAVTASTTGGDSYGIENSVRVGFAQIGRVSASKYGVATADSAEEKVITGITCTGDTNVTGICRTAQIWEPNENTHTAGAKKWYESTCVPRTAAPEGKSAGFYYDDSKTCASLDEYITSNVVVDEIDADDYVDVYDKSYNTYSGTPSSLLNQFNTFTDTEKNEREAKRNAFMTLAPNSITKIRVYIWIEGQDIDNYDFASLGNSISVNFGFTKERFEKNEIVGSGSGAEGGSGAAGDSGSEA